jgi:hypothetical protein
MLVGKGQPRQTDAWIQSKPLRILVSLPLIRRLVSRQTVTMSDKEKQSEKQCKLFRYEISAASQRCQHGMWAANFWHVTDWLTCYCTHFCSVFSAVPWWPLAQPWVDLCDRCIELSAMEKQVKRRVVHLGLWEQSWIASATSASVGRTGLADGANVPSASVAVVRFGQVLFFCFSKEKKFC